MLEPGAAKDAEMDLLMRTTPAMDSSVAAELLLEAKQIFDEAGVLFFLRQGTCLGAIRDHAFITWDDDIDLGSIMGMHGLTNQVVTSMADAFRARGFHVKQSVAGGDTWLGIMKQNIRIDWTCFNIRHGHIAHHPGILIPVSLFTDLKHIDFLGAQFLVPNPPEEYLRCKYGPNWMTPTRLGYAKDVVDNAPAMPILGPVDRIRRFLGARLAGRTVALRVLSEAGEPVVDAEVTVVSLGRSRTDSRGYARLYLPREDVYALVVRVEGREEVLYEELLAPGHTYVYRPDPKNIAGRIFVLTRE
jgi:hypothetical protein